MRLVLTTTAYSQLAHRVMECGAGADGAVADGGVGGRG
jgi:hypothetical protein